MQYAEFVLPMAGDALTEGFKRGDARIVTAFSVPENSPLFEIRYNFGGDEPSYFVLKLVIGEINDEGKALSEVIDFSQTKDGEIEPIDTQIEKLSIICDNYDGKDVRFHWLGE